MLMILLSLLVSGSDPCQEMPTDLSFRQHKVCRTVRKKAAEAGLDPTLAVAVAYHETKFQYRIGAAGEIGPLQAMPKYWCPKRGRCDAIQAGLKALSYYVGRYDTLNESLTRYNGAGRSARRYAKTVLMLHKDLQRKTRPMLISQLTLVTYSR